MTQLAKETGLARPALYRALSPDGHPEFETVLRVLRALGVTLKPVTQLAGTATAPTRGKRRRLLDFDAADHARG